MTIVGRLGDDPQLASRFFTYMANFFGFSDVIPMLR